MGWQHSVGFSFWNGVNYAMPDNHKVTKTQRHTRNLGDTSCLLCLCGELYINEGDSDDNLRQPIDGRRIQERAAQATAGGVCQSTAHRGAVAQTELSRRACIRDSRHTALRTTGRAVEQVRRGDHVLPQSDGVTLNSVYTHDPAIVCNRGAILCGMGKPRGAASRKRWASSSRGWGFQLTGASQAMG